MNRWMLLPAGEGVAKAVSRTLQKTLGLYAPGLGGALISTLVIGVVQLIGGLLGARVRKAKTNSLSQAFGGIFFGLFATVATVLGVWSFTFEGADVGITTFLITSSIVLTPFADRIFFGNDPKNKLNVRQWLGVAIFVFGGWAMFNFPSLDALIPFPIWAWLTLLIAITGVANQVIARKLSVQKAADPFVHNAWVGGTTVLLAILGMIVFTANPFELPSVFWVSGVLVGIMVIAMVSLQLLAYTAGGTIAVRTLVMQVVYLTLAVFLGVIFHNEDFTFGKLTGIGLFAIAFWLTTRR